MPKFEFLTVIVLFVTLALSQPLKYARLNVATADLREEPREGVLQFKFDILQNTQLLYNECLFVFSSNVNGWTKVSSPSQLRLKGSNPTYIPYEGFVKSSQITLLDSPCDIKADIVVKDLWAPIFSRECAPGCVERIMDVSIATRFVARGCKVGWCQIILPDGKIGVIRESNIEFTDQQIPHEYITDSTGSFAEKVLETSKKLLGWVYFWGGRSAYHYDLIKNEKQLSGVDCSGLVGISYLVHNLNIPRDSHDQLMKSKNITDSKFLAGDLFFFSNPSNPARMTHVVMYMGNELIVESTSGRVNATRIATTQQRFGKETSSLRWGELVDGGNFHIFWGRYILPK
jgi:cell wall-associated NlpC family hydrolase